LDRWEITLILNSTKPKPKISDMRSILPVTGLAVILLLSCSNNKTAEKEKSAETRTNSATTTTTQEQTVVPNPLEKLLGSFVGAFGDNKITMLIIKVLGDSVEGRTIVGGNDRPFTGTFTEKDGVYSFVGKEPGDHPDDGVFAFTVTAASPDMVTGSWKPNNPKKPVKQYSLARKKFEYKADVGSWPESSTRLLKPEDVENLPKYELEFMRNEIFARHGYCFKKKNLRQQFEMEDWYVPNTVDIKGFLTDIEKKNISLIKRYEKYAEEYGDEYGR
jgi:hypothetical protein